MLRSAQRAHYTDRVDDASIEQKTAALSWAETAGVAIFWITSFIVGIVLWECGEAYALPALTVVGFFIALMPDALILVMLLAWDCLYTAVRGRP
jgi:hypothetical protein